MKTYMIVTNDALELPVSEEIIGADAVAERLGIKLQRFRRCLCDGFPRKAKYKAVVISDRQHEDKEQYNREYSKRYAMTHDRSEYFRQLYRRKKATVCLQYLRDGKPVVKPKGEDKKSC